MEPNIDDVELFFLALGIALLAFPILAVEARSDGKILLDPVSRAVRTQKRSRPAAEGALRVERYDCAKT